ncbi:hypothetical protein LOK49_LG08G00097 [Camellia lanceoleosa]|uniref:Uncharacterized protein n=1 Tax=Camellia lanceoleosa TaxID=1840588 RepID=A0ACC0GTM2_9ERIC|nr:hypothetical protein LOK49_LG08G00097 [Camellia lanceoleosa]
MRVEERERGDEKECKERSRLKPGGKSTNGNEDDRRTPSGTPATKKRGEKIEMVAGHGDRRREKGARGYGSGDGGLQRRWRGDWWRLG